MLRCQCPSVCPSVTEVHWRIIANLGFKSHFTSHCGRRSTAAVLLAVLLAGGSSRAMLANARSLVIYSDPLEKRTIVGL